MSSKILSTVSKPRRTLHSFQHAELLSLQLLRRVVKEVVRCEIDLTINFRFLRVLVNNETSRTLGPFLFQYNPLQIEAHRKHPFRIVYSMR